MSNFFLCNGQGTVRQAILYGDRSCKSVQQTLVESLEDGISLAHYCCCTHFIGQVCVLLDSVPVCYPFVKVSSSAADKDRVNLEMIIHTFS